jgi:DNA-binding NtrC family response regulator
MRLAPILVIEEKKAERDALVQAIENAGFMVQGLPNGSQALSRIKSEFYSLVITEAQHQDVSGMEIIRTVRRNTPGTEVIVLTAAGTVNGAVEAMQAGAADYLTKPISAGLLEKAIKATLARRASGGGKPDSAPGSSKGSAARRIVTRDCEFSQTLELAQTIAPSGATVLIQGESGTGKELLARYIHMHSHRAEQPYVAVNCAALPETLAESELFGHEKGAFTGAVSRKMGKFETAGTGTIVLDEIGEMPMPLQAKLLRVLQEREIDRIGGSAPIPLRARVITISNVNLSSAVAEARFREDLFYRINVVPLKVPPLRERRGDIPILAQYFLEKFSSENQKAVHRITDDALEMLTNHPWKGNIRELENTIERAVLIGAGETLETAHLLLDGHRGQQNGSAPGAVKVGSTVREMEKELIVKTLKEVDQNRTRAAEMLGISIRTLRNKLREYRQDPAKLAASTG